MNMKKILSTLLVLLVLCSALVWMIGCNPTDAPVVPPSTDDGNGDDNVELNIIDDKYRNWYEIFVHSFYDTNNDGIGDLNGVTAKLDYVKEMGFNGIWLMPIHPSPTYHKYDVTDYYDIDPDYGTLDDFKTLITEAHKRGIRVIIDLVFNHSSDQHPWFKEACNYIRTNGAPGGKYGDFYNFSTTGGGKYTAVSGTAYSYESQFWSGMPDLNLNSENMRAEMVNIMDYWLTEYDVDGFRLDAVTSYYTGYVDKNVEFLSWLNTEAKKIKKDAYIVGEAWVGDDYTINRYYESGVDSFFLFTGAQATGNIATLVKQCDGNGLGEWLKRLQSTYGEDAILAPFLGNHDTMRPGSFMPGEDNLKMAAGVLSMMNGGTFVYYGEEIGMISKGGNNSDPAKRIAMKWQAKNIYSGCCYLPPENTAWDESSYYYPSVEEQQADVNSILNYYKQAMELRNRFPAIARGRLEHHPVADNDYVCVITKTYQNEKITIVFNMDTFEQSVNINLASIGGDTFAGGLYAVGGKCSYENGVLKMPPQSIAIFI